MGELGAFYGGLTGKAKADFGESGAAFVQYMSVFSSMDVQYDDLGRVRIGTGEKQNSIEVGDVLFTMSSENREDCGMTSVVVNEPPEQCYLNSFSTGWRMDNPGMLDPHFAKHMFRSEGVRKQIRKACNGVTRFNLSKPRLLKVKIPIPDPVMQHSIALSLESATRANSELILKLEKEIELLEIQLAEFRNQLLSFPEKAA